MKRVAACIAMLLVSAAAAFGYDWKALKPQGYVSDFASVIDSGSKAQVEAYCAAVQRSTGAEIAIVTLPSLEGEPIDDVANTIFRAWGVGKKGQDTGVMLLLAIGERKSRIEVGYSLEPYITDAQSGNILLAMRPALRQQPADYSDAIKAAAQAIGERISQGTGKQITQQLPRRRYSQPAHQSIPWPLVLGGIFLLLLLMRSGGGRGGYSGWSGGGGGFLPGIILGNMMGRSSWGSRGSGGFGGYDSGDGGFGGFGGGDSGGGGASSDW